MKLNLLSCNAPRPDKRAIATCISKLSSTISDSLAQELTEILLEGDVIDLEMEDKNSGTGLRALRKLSINYEIVA